MNRRVEVRHIGVNESRPESTPQRVANSATIRLIRANDDAYRFRHPPLIAGDGYTGPVPDSSPRCWTPDFDDKGLGMKRAFDVPLRLRPVDFCSLLPP